ncbi:MAG: hypothetical protein PHX04_01280 [Bacilli bacterium]|nr:hypothetical protein [Bacilli bacterium]
MEEKFENINTVNNLIAKLYEKLPLSMEEASVLNSFIFAGINEMKERELHFDYQNTIDVYIVYLEEKEILETITQREAKQLFEYRCVIKAREDKILDLTNTNINEEKKLNLLPANINTTGAVITIVIIEVTILLGILIGVIALVKR